MDRWQLLAIVAIALLIVVALARGYLHRATFRRGDHEVQVESPSAGRFTTLRAKFTRSDVRGRNAALHMEDTDATDSRFDIR